MFAKKVIYNCSIYELIFHGIILLNPKGKNQLRDIEICKLISGGNTYREVGKSYNICGNRVMQIYKKHRRYFKKKLKINFKKRSDDECKWFNEYKKHLERLLEN